MTTEVINDFFTESHKCRWYKNDKRDVCHIGNTLVPWQFPLALIHCSLSFPSCAELNKVALRKGNATHDQVCLDQLPTYLTPSTLSMRFSNETKNSDLRRFEENLVTVASVLLSATTTENPSSTPEEKVPAGTFPTSAKGETTTGGNKDKAFTLSSMFYLDISLVNAIFLWELPANPI